jgi:hypothetical protein
MDASKITQTSNGNSHSTIGFGANLMLACYLSLLFVYVAGTRPLPGLNFQRYIRFWHPHAVSLSQTDFVAFYAELFVIPALVFFLCLKLINRLSLTRLLPAIGGTVAICGFPVACLYGVRVGLLALMELATAVVCFLLWVYGKWPLSTWLNVSLLIIHYVFWLFFAGAIERILSTNRQWDWGTPMEYTALLCAIFGLLFSFVWTTGFGDQNRQHEH